MVQSPEAQQVMTSPVAQAQAAEMAQPQGLPMTTQPQGPPMAQPQGAPMAQPPCPPGAISLNIQAQSHNGSPQIALNADGSPITRPPQVRRLPYTDLSIPRRPPQQQKSEIDKKIEALENEIDSVEEVIAEEARENEDSDDDVVQPIQDVVSSQTQPLAQAVVPANTPAMADNTYAVAPNTPVTAPNTPAMTPNTPSIAGNTPTVIPEEVDDLEEMTFDNNDTGANMMMANEKNMESVADESDQIMKEEQHANVELLKSKVIRKRTVLRSV